MDGMRRGSVYRRALSLFRPFAAPTLIGILLSFIGIAFNLLKPWPFKIIVDDILVRQDAAGQLAVSWVALAQGLRCCFFAGPWW